MIVMQHFCSSSSFISSFSPRSVNSQRKLAACDILAARTSSVDEFDCGGEMSNNPSPCELRRVAESFLGPMPRRLAQKTCRGDLHRRRQAVKERCSYTVR